MSKSDDQARFLLDVCLLVQFATRIGFTVTGGELWRPIEMQEIYFNSGRSKTMSSRHKEKMAVDLNFMMGSWYVNGSDAKTAERTLRQLGIFWESLDEKNRCGLNFDKDFNKVDPWLDVGHFERAD